MKKLIAVSLLCLSANVFATETEVNSTTQTTTTTNKVALASHDGNNVQLASAKVDAYNNALDAPLLNKLKKGLPLTTRDMARLEIIYKMKYVGEEELNPTQAKIYPYTTRILSKKTRAYIEAHTSGEGM